MGTSFVMVMGCVMVRGPSKTLRSLMRSLNIHWHRKYSVVRVREAEESYWQWLDRHGFHYALGNDECAVA